MMLPKSGYEKNKSTPFRSKNNNSKSRYKFCFGCLSDCLRSRRNLRSRKMINAPYWSICQQGVCNLLRNTSKRQKFTVMVTLLSIWWIMIYYFYSLPSDPNYELVDDERKVGRRFDLETTDASWHAPWIDPSAEKGHSSLLHMPHLNFSNLVHLSQHEPLDFAERNFLSTDFDPNMDLSEVEWKAIREKVKSYGNKLLLAWPTIPVPVKGSDTRAVDAIRFLSSCGFEVDLIYWRDFASEIHNDAHDDRPERATLRSAGVQRILGPYETVKLKDSHTFVANYNAMVFWLWPHIEWLDALIEFVEHVAKTNGHTQMIAAIDDVGVAARLLQGSLLNSRDDAVEEVQRFVLRHRPFAGQFDIWKNVTTSLTPQHFDHDKFQYSHVLLQQEMFLYSVSDVLVGINEPTIEFLRQMAPSVPVHRLSYVSPLQPSLERKGNKSILKNSKQFTERSGYVFFGYDNFANNAGMEWFAENVLPKLSKNHILHIAGKVYVPSLCSCNWNKNTCRSLQSNVKCHGALSDEELDLLVASSRVAINPVREPSGVATKTCRALALGTPVVVTDMDGTFDDSYRHSKGGRRCVAEGHGCAPCFVRNLNTLLNDERQWRIASDAAPLFITKHFGAGTYKRDWISIIEEITLKKQYQIILEGDADFHGWSLLSQNWHIAHTLSQQPNTKVTVVANIYNPVIPGTTHVQPWKKTERPPFPTGFHANVVIRQSWPPNFEGITDVFCGSGCRVVHILPWEFGSLPISWIPKIDANIDWLWAPSEYNKRVFEKSGVRKATTAVVPAGVDCYSLSANYTHVSKKTNDPITFLFTGGFIPRKGVDILLDEWQSVFCSDEAEDLFPAARLIIQTSYELGYSKNEISKFEQLIDDCGNIEWRRGWMNRSEYLTMLREGDVYIAPFRSEGFGIPIVESLFLGMSAIASVGGTAADDYMTQPSSSIGEHFKKTLYPVSAHESACTKDPCRGNSLCVFLPCRFGSCTCEQLVNEPSWFEINRDDLRKQMAQAYKDIVSHREKVSHLSYEKILSFAGLYAETLDNDAKSFCWSNLRAKYANAIMTVMNSPIRRTIPAFERSTLIQTPLLIVWLRLSMKFLSRNAAKSLLWLLPLAVVVLIAVVLTGKKKNMKDH